MFYFSDTFKILILKNSDIATDPAKDAEIILHIY